MRGEPHPAVLTWVAAQPRSALHDLCQSGGNSLWHRCPARGPAARGIECRGRGDVRRGFRRADSALRGAGRSTLS